MAFFNVRTLLSLMTMLLIVMSLNGAVESISTREYESMHGVLRGHGYNLVCNAMATSDLQSELLTLPTNASFTIFAPTDASLFALDMIQTASSYTDTLRFHIIPLRLSVSNLHSLASGSVLPTLLPSSALRLTTRPALSLCGIDIVLPGLFYSRHVAVHGLGGILSLTSIVPYASPKLPCPPLTTRQIPKVNTTTTDFNTTTTTFNNKTADFNTTAADLNNTTTADLSPAATLSPEAESAAVTTGPPPSPSPSLSATQEYEISPAFVSEEVDEISLASSPATARSPVVEVSPWTDALRKRARAHARARVRASLMEITTESDEEKSNSESDDDISGKSVPLSDVDVEECGASDEMAIDCFVPEGEAGVDHVSIHHVVRVMA